MAWRFCASQLTRRRLGRRLQMAHSRNHKLGGSKLMKREILSYIALVLVGLGTLRGQTKSDPNPRVGLQAAGVYSLSDIETINQTNGNLTLSIPLGSLGPDRVGNTHGIGLIYNSKIWEPGVEQQNGSPVSTVKPVSPTSVGWKYQIGYELELSTRDIDINACTNPPQELFYYFKL